MHIQIISIKLAGFQSHAKEVALLYSSPIPYIYPLKSERIGIQYCISGVRIPGLHIQHHHFVYLPKGDVEGKGMDGLVLAWVGMDWIGVQGCKGC